MHKRFRRAARSFTCWVTAERARLFGDDVAVNLAATGDRLLVEASPVDAVWGIGLAAADPGAHDPDRWRGLNLLGFALMDVRARLGGQA